MAPPKKSPLFRGGTISPGGARPPTPAGTAALEAQRRTFQEFRLPQRVKLQVNLFRTVVRAFPDAMDFVAEQVAAAKAALDAHNLELAVFPEDGRPIQLRFSEPVIDQVQVNQIRFEAENTAKRPGFVVLFCPFHDNYREVKGGNDLILGEKYGGPGKTVDGREWPSFAIINVRRKSKSGMTLLHEMGHGAGLSHFEGTGDLSNFMYMTDTDQPGQRRGILIDQVMALADSHFAVPRFPLTPAIKKLARPSTTSRELFAGRW